MAAMPVYAHVSLGSSVRSLLERIKCLLEFARELLINADGGLVNSFKRSSFKASADLGELHGVRRGVAQSLCVWAPPALGRLFRMSCLFDNGDFRFCDFLAAHGIQRNRRNLVLVASQG